MRIGRIVVVVGCLLTEHRFPELKHWLPMGQESILRDVARKLLKRWWSNTTLDLERYSREQDQKGIG